MDDTFHSNAYSTLPGSQLHQLNSLPHLSSQRYSDHHGETQILPPINGLPGNLPYNFASIHGNGGNTSQTPIAPHASSTPTTMSSGHNFGFPQMPSQPPLRTLQPPLPAFSQPGSAYSVSQAAVPSVTTAYSNSQSFTSAPMTTSMHNIRPRPQGGLGFPMSYGQPLLSQPHALPNTEPEPTHVVGQQGRRGVLPSAPGRAAPGSAKTLIPQKDADGKFPCPHCTKTYLHAKHLKRHLLRRKYPILLLLSNIANSKKTPAIDLICANSVKTHSPGVIYSSAISRSVPYVGVLQETWIISRDPERISTGTVCRLGVLGAKRKPTPRVSRLPMVTNLLEVKQQASLEYHPNSLAMQAV